MDAKNDEFAHALRAAREEFLNGENAMMKGLKAKLQEAILQAAREGATTCFVAASLTDRQFDVIERWLGGWNLTVSHKAASYDQRDNTSYGGGVTVSGI